jgi:phage terminase large subunit GpA-like protein
VPDWADFLVAFVDVQATMLFYMVTAFNRQLRGAVIGYDGWPSQGRRYFTKSDSRISLQASYGAATAEHALQIGIQDLAAKLLEKSFQTQTKGELAIDLVMIDANYAASTEIVYQLARTIGGGKVIPAHGRYFGATTSSIDSWKKEPGDKAGPGWRLQAGKKRQRHFINDVNYWKTIAASRLQTSPDTLGIGFYGSSHQEHALLIDHCSSEYAIDHESQGRKLRDWKLKPGRDNDFWDGLVGCCVGASYLGAEVPGHTAKPKARRVSFAEMQAKRKSGL